MTSFSKQMLASLARGYCSDRSKKTLKGKSINYTEPVYFKSNVRCVVGRKEEGEEKEYLRVIKGKTGRDGWGVWDFSTCTLSTYRKGNNKALLYSRGDYIQYPGINHNGEEYKKECMCTTESLCCTAEINTTL